jgi:hypothetical protein
MRHWDMDLLLHCSGFHHISLQWALLGHSLEYKATACLSLVPVWRISAILIKPVQDVKSTYPEHGCSKLLLHVSTACTHCVLSQKIAIHVHQHHCEKLKSHYCIFWSSFLCLHGLVLWEETTSFLFNIRGACLMCLYNLLCSSGRTTIKSWISNKLPCKTEKSVYVSCLLTVWCGEIERIFT